MFVGGVCAVSVILLVWSRDMAEGYVMMIYDVMQHIEKVTKMR